MERIFFLFLIFSIAVNHGIHRHRHLGHVAMLVNCILDPNALKNPDHLKIFPTPQRMKELFFKTKLHFAPGLLDTIQSTSPPSMEFFKDLPLHLVPCWAVYILVLEKEHCLEKIYIGSATAFPGGAFVRLHQYQKRVTLPSFVAKALDDGYNIS